jgi:hypothetical protein
MDRTVGRSGLRVPSSSSLEPWAVIHFREEKRVDVRSSWNRTHIRRSSAQQPVVVSVQSRISEQAREKVNQRSLHTKMGGMLQTRMSLYYSIWIQKAILVYQTTAKVAFTEFRTQDLVRASVVVRNSTTTVKDA